MKENKVLINTVVRSVNKLDGSNIKIMENSMEKQIGKPTQINMKVILDQEVDSSTKAENDATTTQVATTTAKEGAVLNADKTIEYAIKDKLALSNAKLVDFSFDYSSSSGEYSIDVKAEGTEELLDDTKKSIENVLEDELNRKITVNIDYSKIAADSNTDTQSDPSIESDIYKP